MKIQNRETALEGKWIVVEGRNLEDSVCERIKWLTTSHLKKIAISKQWGAWETLFQDPDDGRFWEQTFPQGEMHGGGPPALNVISEDAAKKKYEF